jgi:hypothetical protein
MSDSTIHHDDHLKREPKVSADVYLYRVELFYCVSELLIILNLRMKMHRLNTVTNPSYTRTPLWNRKKRQTARLNRNSTPLYIRSMHVPSDSFGGRSPEKQASVILESLFTFIAAKIVLAQMQGSGRGDLGSYGGEQYTTLVEFMLNHPLHKYKDVKEWLALLMEKDAQLALRVIEVRYAYCTEAFEWHSLEALCAENLSKDNVTILRQHATKLYNSPGGEDVTE